MKLKKGLGVFALILVGVIIAVFYFKDDTNMDQVNHEQEQSAADSANSKIDLLNDEFEFDESEIEDATMAYDTIK